MMVLTHTNLCIKTGGKLGYKNAGTMGNSEGKKPVPNYFASHYEFDCNASLSWAMFGENEPYWL